MGLVAIFIEIGFGIWSASGKPWYWYPINIILLTITGSIFNTSFIQGLTRCYSVIVIKGRRGFGEVFVLGFLTLIGWAVAYILSQIVFADYLQTSLFFGSCIAMSIVVTVKSDEFRRAKSRTLLFQITPDADEILTDCERKSRSI